jgi:hypothetical protein
MKLKYLFITMLLFLLVGCAAQPQETAAPLGAGFRYSTYGVSGEPGAAYWASVGQRMAAKFPGSVPQAIWIVGNIYDEGTYLNFPCETDDPNIKCGYADMNEAALTLFDEEGVQVWLQVEAGNADMETLIDIVLEQYGSHPCVIGFGADVEWYKSTTGPLGVPITDEEAARWVAAVRAHNPAYRLFLKHWEIEWMPPTAREGILFINDHQEFESLEAMIENYTAWGEHFSGYPVGYQFGYHSDAKWWREFEDPASEIGNAILKAVENTQALFWVDFTVLEVFPPQ